MVSASTILEKEKGEEKKKGKEKKKKNKKRKKRKKRKKEKIDVKIRSGDGIKY